MRARRVVWTARILLAALFVFGGGMMLAGGAEAVEAFRRLGLGTPGRIAIGCLELAGGIGLVLTPVAGLAALGLAVIMMGAIISHLVALGGSPLPAVVVLAVCLAIAWSERANVRTLGMLRSGKGPMDGWVARAYDRGIQDAFRDLLPTVTADVLPQLASARRILDVGCGPGQFTVFAAERLPQADITGIDLAPTMIERARARSGFIRRRAAPLRGRRRGTAAVSRPDVRRRDELGVDQALAGPGPRARGDPSRPRARRPRVHHRDESARAARRRRGAARAHPALVLPADLSARLREGAHARGGADGVRRVAVRAAGERADAPRRLPLALRGPARVTQAAPRRSRPRISISGETATPPR